MLDFRYPSRALVGDWLRAICGLTIGLGVLLFTPLVAWRLLVFGGITVLFAYFGWRTLERQIQRVALSDEGLVVHDWRLRALPWSTLQGFRLRFYGTRRQQRRLQDDSDPTGGFLELRLSFAGSRLVLDSALPGFALVAWRAARAARACHLSFDPVSAGNLLTLGVDPDQDTAPPELAAEWAEAQVAGEGFAGQ